MRKMSFNNWIYKKNYVVKYSLFHLQGIVYFPKGEKTPILLRGSQTKSGGDLFPDLAVDLLKTPLNVIALNMLPGDAELTARNGYGWVHHGVQKEKFLQWREKMGGLK